MRRSDLQGAVTDQITIVTNDQGPVSRDSRNRTAVLLIARVSEGQRRIDPSLHGSRHSLDTGMDHGRALAVARNQDLGIGAARSHVGDQCCHVVRGGWVHALG